MVPCSLEECRRFQSFTLADLEDPDKLALLRLCRLCQSFLGFQLYQPVEKTLSYLVEPKEQGEKP
jgi:hypothetical protein